MAQPKSVETVRGLSQALADSDFETAAGFLGDDAVLRVAGVPRSLGGLFEGKEQIVNLWKSNPAFNFDIRKIFGDDTDVCLLQKVSADTFQPGQYLKGSDKPFSEYQALVFRVDGGKIAEITQYTNWMSVYTQVGLLDMSALTA